MTDPKLHFWFDFASTYSYLSAMRIESLATKADIEIVWEPFLLGPIFAAQGWTDSPFNIYAAKGRYMWRDLERRCAVLGLPFQRPKQFPQHSLRAARLGLALRGTPQLATFCRAVFSAQFAHGGNISESELLHTCLSSAGANSDLADKADNPDIKAALRRQGDRARALGLFGAPSFTIGPELFWGDDRLEDAIAFAAQISDANKV
jgi:2-hydroxychromene-2-carboxylate isomerase